MMKRFVVIATLKRGALKRFEPLDADGQAAAFERMWMDSGLGNTVVWNAGSEPKLPPRSYQPRAMVDRLMELAEKVG